MTDAPDSPPLSPQQEAYNLLYRRYVRLEAELGAALRALNEANLAQANLAQANTDTHMSARPWCSACDT